ncbi:MAG: NAD(P)/FAD-dependent oxidoreductase [Nitriliruptoraceae bacterium]
MSERFDAVIVGAGPNGLTAAVTLARQGLAVCVVEAADEVGGGMRTVDDPQFPGIVHDHCSAVHPLALASPALAALPLADCGLEWCHPDIAVGHPRDDGSAGLLYRDLDATAEGLGVDGDVWRRLVGPSVDAFDTVAEQLLGPVARFLPHPMTLLGALRAAPLPAARVLRRFTEENTRALFAGIAAHAMAPLHQPLTAGVGLFLAAAAHAVGWPFARGGSSAIARALAVMLTDLGGTIRTGMRVRSLGDVPRARVVLLDVVPQQAVAILGGRLPSRHAARLREWRHGPAAFKVDYVVEDGVPWAAAGLERAGTVHLGGDADEVIAAERATSAGRSAPRPFVLVAQPATADETRRVGGHVPVWAYAHVPHASTRDATPLIDAQIERFAPGFLERVRARQVTTPADFARDNPNFIGGDIAGGASDGWQLISRPRRIVNPYATGIPGVVLCSASTPPGAGVHGMCGFHAAQSVLRVLTA